ncbi:protocadherin gamma-C3-like [Triplophysa dalaica]|uniref:protocadherin gamma-C3-like n=1 Tax=Triplophysa dalaica TaxID=1582913 RepID=UPI0024E020CE|nr:protocadherin gamma-C3-like [Triplophysa dalaica]
MDVIFIGSLFVWVLFLLCSLDLCAGQIVYTVTEEGNKATVVGNVAKDLNLNVNDLQSGQFHIVNGLNKNYFEVNLKTGELYVGERIDRENICLTSQTCTLNIEAIAQNPLRLFSIGIDVLDINDNSPLFPIKTYHLNITESAFPGDRFPLPKASDADVGINSIRSYKLSINDYFSLDVQNNGGHSVYAELVLQKALDREKMTVIKLILTAVDGGKPPRSGTVEIVVDVVDVNDNTPTFSQQLYKVTIPENTVYGVPIIRLNASDIDSGLNGHIIYSIINHGKDKALEYFYINPSSGEITVKGELDREDTSAFELHVKRMTGARLLARLIVKC